jgi:hypothetical protein
VYVGDERSIYTGVRGVAWKFDVVGGNTKPEGEEWRRPPFPEGAAPYPLLLTIYSYIIKK